MAEIRKIDFFWVKSKREAIETLDKSLFLNDICEKYKVTPDEIAYVGDDFYDLSMLDAVGWSFCPLDAALDVKLRVKEVIMRNSGDGVVEELYNSYSSLLMHGFPYDNI